MPRPPLQIGTHGEIRIQPHGERYRAITNYRDHSGTTKQVERVGSTEAKAKKALKDALRDSSGNKPSLTSRSRFRDLADTWLAQVQARRSSTTQTTYRRVLDNVLNPRIGDRQIPELSVPDLEELFDDLEVEGYSAGYRRSIRTCVRGPLGLAVRRGLLDANPVRDLSTIEGRKTKVRALNAEERTAMLARLDELCVTDQYFRGSDLPAFVRFMLGTGARIGEALAVRWRDLNLGDDSVTIDGQTVPPRSLWINGNIVNVTGEGLVRHDGKTETADRILALPEFLVTLLQVRRPVEADADEPVFPSQVLGWKNPNNINRTWRSAREKISGDGFDFTWVIPHVFRKTAATILDDQQLTARQIADQLGHSDPSLTQNVYMGRGNTNPAAAAALDAAYRT